MSEMGIGICVTVLWEMRNNVFPLVLAMSVYDLETKCSSRVASLRDPVRVLVCSSPVLPVFMKLVLGLSCFVRLSSESPSRCMQWSVYPQGGCLAKAYLFLSFVIIVFRNASLKTEQEMVF